MGAKELGILLGAVAVWFVLTRCLLPRAGVST